MDVAAETVQLRDDDRSLVLLGRLERGRQLRPALESIGALAGFDLIERLQQVIAFSLSEPGECLLLGLQAKT
jgi:hypothetical protein